MIAQINFDGKDRIAIVLDEVYSFDSLALYQKSIINVLMALESSCDENCYQDDKANVLQFMAEMFPNIDQSFAMLNKYFNGGLSSAHKAEKRPCEIYI